MVEIVKRKYKRRKKSSKLHVIKITSDQIDIVSCLLDALILIILVIWFAFDIVKGITHIG